ncbi:FAD/NAD(P)-binding protein [Nanoarchaeota archaeon]
MNQEQMMQDNPFIPKPVKIKRVLWHGHDNFSMYVDWKEKYQPGQFAQLSVLGIGECPISFASYGKDYVEFNISIVGSVTQAMSKLKKGDTIYIRGPYGKGYPFKDFKKKDLIFIGGGCGVAPLKGAIECMEYHRKDFKNIWLFMGFRSPENILFKTQIRGWRKAFKTHLTVDNVEDHSCYIGEVGYITNAVRDETFDSKDKVVMICGPPIMMVKTVEILLEKGFTPEQIFVSTERLMHCAIGKCGACMIRGIYTCLDGPVFRYDEIMNYKTD